MALGYLEALLARSSLAVLEEVTEQLRRLERG